MRISKWVCDKLYQNRNIIMINNTIALKNNWSDTKGKLRQQYANLSHNDTFFSEMTQEELLERLQVKLGKTKLEIEEILSCLPA